jgi:hypothetical protein
LLLPNTTAPGTLTITDGGEFFDFNRVNLEGVGLSYRIQGYSGNVLDYTINSTCNSSLYTTVDGEPVGVTEVLITLKDSGLDRVESLDVTPKTEPRGLLLLGTGHFGLALALFRKAKPFGLISHL